MVDAMLGSTKLDKVKLGAIRRVLYTDPAWSAYAIADLQDGVVDTCDWHLESGNAYGVEDDALVMLYKGTPLPVLFAIGGNAAVARILARIELPEQVYLSIRAEHEDAIRECYDYSAHARPMYRMVQRRTEAENTPAQHELVRLLPDDAPRIEALIGQGGDFAPDAFSPWQVANGVFYGVEDRAGELVAVGGTHIVDWGAGVGTVGNFYTRTQDRRHGYGSALLNAIVRDLRAGAVDTIVLNVDQRNRTASHLYEHNGFVVHCAFTEGVATLRKSS